MLLLLKRLGNPQDSVPTIHITGSKGKGSTATLIASILKASGYKTALYTSPHLHSYCERIAFDLKPVSEALFAQGIAAITDVFAEEDSAPLGTLSTFGLLTALYFHLVRNKSKEIDWQIVEVGMGGTHDATNVCKNKDVAVITAISLEHTEVLGKTIAEIVKNKAGVITPGCATVLARQRETTVQEIVRSVSSEKGARFIDAGSVFTYERSSQNLEHQTFFLDSSDGRETYSLKLLGQHQIENAMTAVAVTQALQERGAVFSSQAIRDGLAEADLPGRFEILTMRLPNMAVNDKIVILDGAHNQDSARALSETIQSVFPTRRCLLILGVNGDKHLESIWLELKDGTRQVIATRSENPRSLPPFEITRRLSKVDPDLLSHSRNNIREALDHALTLATESDVICVTGSLYLVAEAREQILKHQRISIVHERV
jgi:dihydrofolate synthase/folylpolyglutamate synthase